MSAPQNINDDSVPDSRFSRREALSRSARAGLIFYAAPQILGSVEVAHAQVISPGGTTTELVPGGGSSGLAYLGLLPLAALPFVGGAGAAAAAGGAGAVGGAGAAGIAVPPTFFGIPLATTNPGTLIGRAGSQSPVPVPRRRAILGPRGGRRPPRLGGPGGFGRGRRPIRGLG